MPSELDIIQQAFPGVTAQNTEVTSPRDSAYNCVAHSLGDQTRSWWPQSDQLPPGAHYWPQGYDSSETIDSFVAMLASEGFLPCDDGAHQVGVEKLAIYSRAGRPTHIAVQTADGRWASKLAFEWDIVHDTLEVLESITYGVARVFLERALVEESQPSQG